MPKKHGTQTWINLGKYCGRCAEYDKHLKNLQEDKPSISKFVLKEEYVRVLEENKQLRIINKTLTEDKESLLRAHKMFIADLSDEKTRRQNKRAPYAPNK